MSSNRCHERHFAKGLAAGIVGGLVASWVMDRFQAVSSEVTSALKEGEQQAAQGEGSGGASDRQETGQALSRSENCPASEPATVKAAEALSRAVFHRELTDSQKKLAGPVMHYLMGVATAADYGVLAELRPEITAGVGLPFGAAVWAVADEIGVYALGLSKPPSAYPASTHVYALASHCVYGTTTELVRRIVRNVL